MPVEKRFEPSLERRSFDAALDKAGQKLRADPRTVELARGFGRLRDELHLDEEEIARRVGVPMSVVSHLLALLKQPEETQKPVADESGHPRLLESIADGTKRIELAEPAAKQRLIVRETERRVREVARSASAQTSDATIASAPAESARRAAEESGSRAPLRSSESSVSPAVDTTTQVASESADLAALHSSEPSVSAPTEIRNTSTRESTSSLHSPDAIAEPSEPSPVAAQATIEDVPRWEVERRMQLSGELMQSPTIEETIASWCTAISSLVRGPLRNALWEFYDRITEAATWWRIIKRVLHFLARFIPGREPEPTKLQKAIKECFSFLHEPPPSEPESPPKKPDADPPKAA